MYGYYHPQNQQYTQYYNPTIMPNDQTWEACRDRCARLGFQPGTAAWQNCVHGCMGQNTIEREQMSLPDQWVEYIQPLVDRALEEVEEGINLTHLFQEFILSGVLVGQGFEPEEAIEQVELWEKGESKLLQQSKMMNM
ncbi:hypothetical protein [Halobacillus campisalis]|uniref:Uncharacterized protein n=1 Tax=Halobacillus campisalis TaxID=435909 RepID=A0ABW2K0M1_9BACI